MNFENQINGYIELINDGLEKFIPETDAKYRVVRDAMRYSVQAGGKRLRPVLTLAICEMLGGDAQSALPFACAVECIHVSSLIHDDLPCMDDDDMRRGKPSCHIAFDYATALLAGDALLLAAFEIISKAGEFGATPKMMVKATNVLASYSGVHGMVGGQVIDLKTENTKVDEETLSLMHLYKTGALIKAACEMGAIAAGGGEKDIKKIRAYADSLGLAFQACDDILDVEGNQEDLGKPVGSDEQQNKTNYISLIGLEGTKIRAKELTDNALDNLSEFNKNEFMIDITQKMLKRKY